MLINLTSHLLNEYISFLNLLSFIKEYILNYYYLIKLIIIFNFNSKNFNFIEKDYFQNLYFL